MKKLKQILCGLIHGHAYSPIHTGVTYRARTDEVIIEMYCVKCNHRTVVKGRWHAFWMIGVEKKHDNRTEENGDSGSVSV